MPINVLMPALSPTMEEGSLAKWLVKEGDSVTAGDVIAEIETDKATMEVEAVDDGVVEKIVKPEGSTSVKVNEVIAILRGEDEAEGEREAAPSPPAAEPKPAASAAAATPAPAGVGAGPSEDFNPPPVSAVDQDGRRIFASPLARRLAAEHGLDLSRLSGSGPHGRIVKTDVEAAASAGAAAPLPESPTPQAEPPKSAPPAPQPTAPASAPPVSSDRIRQLYKDRDYEEVTLDGMRRTIADRLSEAKRTIPHFYLRRDIELDPLLALRKSLNDRLGPTGAKLSVNDFIIKASALALQRVPGCNAVWAGDRVLRFTSSDVAVAVAVEGGLFTPVLRDAHLLTLSAISTKMRDLAARARSRKLAPQEYQGGAFAISNLGMYGVDSFDAVINPPHGSILAVGAGARRPVARGDELAVATVMSVTLSVDHRVIDGALGAGFLAELKTLLEDPMSMLV